ncbi:hypothetical protein [Salininema proteolyticum]|uniref:Uncharacterized protein n=1 Tax=Salininema proteolyticum TaxID=1607685 RepID=A0ABV8U5B7_9ACTN
MKLDGRKWRTLVGHARLGGDRYRVVRPARRLRHCSLHEGRLGAQLSIDKGAAKELAAAWWLASRSPRSLVHLPLRSSGATCGEEYGGRRLDLVLLHHSLQFPVSRWKEVRSRLRSPLPRTVRLPPGAFPRFPAEAHHRKFHSDFTDRLLWSIAADTLFLIGSRRAFDLEGDSVRALAEECPAHLAEVPGSHCCAEIDMGRRGTAALHERRSPPATLHVEYCNRHC